jgi:hypothetical protein
LDDVRGASVRQVEALKNWTPSRRILVAGANTIEELRVLPREKLARGAIRAAVSLVAGLLLFRSAPAVAGEGCALTVRAKGLEKRWSQELQTVTADLARRADVDCQASILVERAAGGARMVVVLKDGRSTERTVSDPLDMRAIATALVLLPALPAPPLPPGTPPSLGEPRLDQDHAAGPPSPPLEGVGPSGRDRPLVDLAPRSASQGRTRLDLGGAGGSRWSGAAPGGGVGAFADVRLGEWVLGAHGRWDGYAATSGSVAYTMQALAIGAELGHDFRIGATSLTLLVGPSFVALSQKLQSAPPSVYVSTLNPKTGAPIGNVAASPRDGQVLRIGSIARWTVFSRARLRLFVAADVELDVTSDPGNRAPEAPATTSPLPIWSAGLSLGGAVAVWP